MKSFLRTALLGLSTSVILASATHGGDLSSGQWFGQHVPQNGPLPINGNVWTSQHIYYVGDELNIQLDFPRGAALVASRAVDAHVVVFARAGAVYDIPVPADWGAKPRKLWSIPHIDIDTLPEGQYQVALVLTVPGGNAKRLDDWHGGLRGLLDSESIYVAATPIASDKNIDGEHDDDTDRDGITGEQDFEVDDDAPR